MRVKTPVTELAAQLMPRRLGWRLLQVLHHRNESLDASSGEYTGGALAHLGQPLVA